MKCFSCNNEIEVGDRYIEDTASGFLRTEQSPEVDAVIAELFSGRMDGKVVFCDECTTEGGDYNPQVYYGDDDDED
jgi:hypothetical protein